MRRAALLCLALSGVLPACAQQSPLQPRTVLPIVKPSTPNMPPVPGDTQQQQQQQQSIPAPWYCAATAPVGGTPFPTLIQVPRTDTALEYAGYVQTWTPIDNWNECHLRQIYFSIPDSFGIEPDGAYPDLFIETVARGTNTLTPGPVTYDIVPLRLYTGLITFRVDAQSPTPLYGDYDFYVSIVGVAKQAPQRH